MKGKDKVFESANLKTLVFALIFWAQQCWAKPQKYFWYMDDENPYLEDSRGFSRG